MNKHCYRIIFNKTLGRLVVTSELAKREGKSHDGQGVKILEKTFEKNTALLALSSCLKPLSFSLFCALGFVSLLLPTDSLAETLIIKADPTANANQRPVVLETANGIPQVNIQTPNEKGLSHNRYQSFDVDSQGAILNNSRKATQTQQGGWVQGNPYLAGGEAKVIVNEVNSNKPSQLKGYVEVAGKKADVVIANPSGVHCEGCGVINAERATISTGKVDIAQGELKGFKVEKGKVRVTGKGMDNSQSDYTDIIAHEAEIQSGVWAKKEIKVTTGKNYVSKNNDSVQIQHQAKQSEAEKAEAEKLAENNPHFAVDVSELGGMYAEKVHLVATESGLGVRNAGHIGASAGNVQIDSEGKIHNSGKIASNQGDVSLNSQNELKNSEKASISANQGSLQIQAKKQLENQGMIAASQDVKLQTQGKLDNQKTGEIIAKAGNVSLQSQSLEQAGKIGAKQQIQIQTQQLNQQASGEIQAGNVRIEAGKQLTNRGLINSQQENNNAKTLLKAEHIQNLGTGRIYGDQVALGAKRIENKDEVVEGQTHSAAIAGRERVDLGASEILNQNEQYSGNALNGTQIYSAGSLHIGGALNVLDQAIGRAQQLRNESALIESAGDMQLGAEEIINRNNFFKTELQVVSDKAVDWHYIVPEGVPEEELRIASEYLRKDSSVRGKDWLEWKENPEKLKKPTNGDVKSHFLPEVKICTDAQCEIAENHYYLPSDPAWAAFRINPQQRGTSDSALTQAKVPTEPTKPVEPNPPRRQNARTQAAYQQQLAQYEQDKAQYEKDYAQYQQDKAQFERDIKPLYLQWMKDNASQFQQLAAEISAHNQKLDNEAHKEYVNYWIKDIDRQVIKEDVVIQSQAAQILAGGDLSLDSNQIINDKSTLIAGGTLTTSAAIENLNHQGMQITETYGIEHLSKRKEKDDNWRRPRKKYYRDDYDQVHRGKLSEVSHSITLPVARQFEHYQYADDELKEQYTGGEVKLPTSSLYKINPDADSHVLVETDPAFTNRKKWLSSDYMFALLRSDHNNVHKRLGDGYYEQRLVRDQINQLTGRQFLGNYQNFEEQYKSLMDNGSTFAKRFNLSVGVALTPEQVNSLTSDIVWFETKTVILANGQKTQVLVPKLYVARTTKSDLSDKGALISANQIVINTTGNITNSGTIAGHKVTYIDAQNIYNQGGEISADRMQLLAKDHLQNLGGKLEAENALVLQAGKDIQISSTTSTNEVKAHDYSQRNTQIDRQALVHVKGENGRLHLEAQNIHLTGANLRNEGKGDTSLIAHQRIDLDNIQTESAMQIGSGDNYRHEKVQRSQGSEIYGRGNVQLSAENIQSTGSTLSSQQQLQLNATQNIELNAAQESLSFEEYHKEKYRGLTSRSTHERFTNIQAEQQKGTTLDAENVSIHAGNNLNSTAALIHATQDITLQAGNEINLNAGKNQRSVQHWEKSKKSGFGGSLQGGVIAVGYQKSKSGMDSKNYDEQVVGTQVVADKGNLSIQAGNHLNANATELSSGADMHLQGSEVNLNAMDETHRSNFHSYQKSTGFGVNMVYNPYQFARNQYRQREQQGATKGVVGKSIAYEEAVLDTTMAVMKGITPYFKHQQSESNKSSENILEKTTALNAGGKLDIQTTGGNLTTQGSQINAGGDASFIATGNVNFDVATDRFSQQSNSRNKGIDLNGLSRQGAGFASGREKGTQRITQEQGTVITTGGASLVQAQGDIKGKGLTLVAEGKNRLEAEGDIRLTTAETRQSQEQSRKNHAIGDIATSETERFSGYHRERYNQDGDELSHSGSHIVSLKNNVEIQAGKDYQQTSSELLAPEKISINAQNIKIDAAHNELSAHQSQSDLKIGGFARVKSPIIDLIQTVERSIKNKDASDRLKAANAMSIVAQGYTLADTALKSIKGQPLNDSAYLVRLEAGVGVAHSRQSQESEAHISQGNLLNAKEIELTARGNGERLADGSAKLGDISIQHADLTSNGKDSKRMADSHISLNANRIDIEAGRSDSKEKSRGQNVGGEVGVFAQAGAQTGVGVYATLGGGSNKVDGHSITYHNSHLDSSTVTINSQGDTRLRGAQAKGNSVHINAGGDLNIESLQDEAEFKSRGSQAGVHVQVGIGNAWSANANASAERGTTSRKQVNEQAGIFAEDGGYHVNADNVHLKGAAIASTNAENSELATNNFSFEDIENHSESSAVSGSISGGYNHTTRTPSLSPGMPMYQHSQDSTTTKSVLTEGKITLNKDSQPQQTTASALGIQTSLENANNQVAETENVQKQLAEQKEIREAINNVQSAVNTYTANQATEAARAVEKLEEELAQAKAEGDNQKISEKTTALLKAQADAEAWQLGGSKKRTVDTVTAIITTALAGKTGAEIAVAASSPSINEFIHEKTKDNKATNLLAHAVLSATEFYVAGQDPLTGAFAGVAGEGTAMLLAEKVFNKKPAELSAEEKETLRIASMLAGGLVGAVGNSSASSNHGANGLASATEGMATAKRAVENNYLYAHEAEERFQLEWKKKQGIATEQDLARLNELNRLDKERDKALISACAGGITSQACQQKVEDAQNARDSYKNLYPNQYLVNYGGMLPKDLNQISDLISDKEGETLDFQRKAEIIAKNWNISVERAKLLIRATATINNLSGFFAGAKSPVVSKTHKPGTLASANEGKLNTTEPVASKNHKPESVSSANGGKLNTAELVANKANKPETAASANGNKPNKVAPVANKPTENLKPEVHSDLNIGKNRKDFNVDLNNKINEKPKNIRDEQVRSRVADIAYQFNTKSIEPKDMKLTINGQTYNANPETSTGVPVFKGVSDQNIISYFKELAGIDKLPLPKEVSGKGRVWSVKPKEGPLNGSVINLRDYSNSTSNTNAKFTIDIVRKRNVDRNISGIKRDRIEIKFEK